MAKNRKLVESRSVSGEESNSRKINLQESESESDQRNSNPEETSSSSQEESGSGSESRKSRSDAAPTVTKAREQREIKADTCVKKSNDESKKLLFQRIWSEDDEIAILNGLMEYSRKKKSDPMANLSAFHDFIKKNLHMDVTRTQLQHKIRRLKKKYQNNRNRAKDGKDRTFSKSHEQKAYDLSKTLWGNEIGKKKGRENWVSKRVAEDVKEGAENRGALIVRREGENSSLGRAGAELFEGGKEWKKLRMEEVELHCKQLELKLAQSRLILDVLKSNDS
ncbi:hypothetical protein ACS0TY_031934 [Phlomoides rotata]